MISGMGLRELAAELAAGNISSRELTAYFLACGEGQQKALNAYITITRERALATADRVDRERRQGRKLCPLAGIPMALKDNLSTKGVPTTCASRVLAEYIPPYDATVVAMLADCPLLGKANMDEFAMGSSGQTSAFGAPINPWDHQRSPGGSSGGSAALVAVGCAPFSLGSDTGGSVRQPAAFCGVTGFKPSYGRVSRYGLLPMAPSLDQVGILTRTVADSAIVLQAISGHDPADLTSSSLPVPDYTQALTEDISGLTIGLCLEIQTSCPDKEISLAVEVAARGLEAAGAKIEWVSMPYFDESLAAYMLIATAEAASSLAKYDGVAYGYRRSAPTVEKMYVGSRAFGAEVRRRLLLGTFSLWQGGDNYSYEAGQRIRRHIGAHLTELFSAVDLLLLPATPSVAFASEDTPDPHMMHFNDAYSIPANLAGLPAISLPCGQQQGLPIGMQLWAPRFREDMLFRVGYAWQQLSDWHKSLPGEASQ